MKDQLAHNAETCCRQVCDAIGAYHNIAATLIIERAMRGAVEAMRERCAAIADAQAKQSREHAARGYPNEADLTAEVIAEQIRELSSTAASG